MHELAVCQALIGQVESIAHRESAARITAIHLAIGPLSGIEAELLRRAWPLAAAGTVAEQAQLLLTAAAIRVRCSTCGEESAAIANRLVCGHCGDWRTRLLSGDEMLLTRVELERSPAGLAEQSDPLSAATEGSGHV